MFVAEILPSAQARAIGLLQQIKAHGSAGQYSL